MFGWIISTLILTVTVVINSDFIHLVINDNIPLYFVKINYHISCLIRLFPCKNPKIILCLITGKSGYVSMLLNPQKKLANYRAHLLIHSILLGRKYSNNFVVTEHKDAGFKLKYFAFSAMNIVSMYVYTISCYLSLFCETNLKLYVLRKL